MYILILKLYFLLFIKYYKDMNIDIKFQWCPLKIDTINGINFQKINFNNCINKYYIFCYFGYPTYMGQPSNVGKIHIKCVFRLKKRVDKNRFVEIFSYNHISHNTYDILDRTVISIIENQITKAERQEKIQKLLENF